MTAEDERLRRVAEGASTILRLAGEVGHEPWVFEGPQEVVDFFDKCDPIGVLGLLDRLAAADAALADVRRYSTMTLDSCSVERQGMATDVLALMDAALRGAS